jgi:hypothetical protein
MHNEYSNHIEDLLDQIRTEDNPALLTWLSTQLRVVIAAAHEKRDALIEK